MSFIAASCVYSSMVHHNEKRLIVKAIHTHDEFIKAKLNVAIDYKHLKEKLRKLFFIYWASIGSCYISYTACSYFLSPLFFVYSIEYEFLVFVIHLQAFQFFIFATAIKERLNVLSNIKAKSVDQAVTVKKALISIHEITCKSRACFSSSIFISYIWLYGCAVSNLHWISIALLGVPYAHVFEGILGIFPSIAIIFMLGLSDFETQRHRRHLISKCSSAKSLNGWNEEILTVLYRKHLNLTSYNLLQIGFQSVTKVNLIDLHLSAQIIRNWLFADIKICFQSSGDHDSVSNR